MDALRRRALVSVLKNLAMVLSVHFETSLAEGCNVEINTHRRRDKSPDACEQLDGASRPSGPGFSGDVGHGQDNAR